MASPSFTIRRATLDDIETLRGLWRECRLPEHELERRFTEFQLAVDAHDWILGALGLRFAGPNGQVHSLAIRRADIETELRDALLERVIALANQQNAHRLWTREPAAFWSDHGFREVDSHDRRELPPAFGHAAAAWKLLKLREDPLKLIAAEEQLEAFLELERLKTDQLVRRGQILKLIATIFAAVLLVLALGALLLLMRRRSSPGPAQP